MRKIRTKLKWLIGRYYLILTLNLKKRNVGGHMSTQLVLSFEPNGATTESLTKHVDSTHHTLDFSCRQAYSCFAKASKSVALSFSKLPGIRAQILHTKQWQNGSQTVRWTPSLDPSTWKPLTWDTSCTCLLLSSLCWNSRHCHLRCHCVDRAKSANDFMA